MGKQKNSKNKGKNMSKAAVETLKFQVRWGLKQQGVDESEMLQRYAAVEADSIEQCHLTQDILAIKTLVDSIRKAFSVEPVADNGDFTHSAVALALGIGKIDDITKMEIPKESWEEMIYKKMLKICYPADMRNQIAAWAKENGYTTSTYLGKPIVKFSVINILLERSL